MQAVRVTLTDDHQIIRVGLRALISAQPDLTLVGEAGSVSEMVTLVAREKPDVALLDVNMPDGDGLSMLDTLRSVSPSSRLLVLTMHAEAAVVRRAVAAGAHGFVTKSAEPDEVIGAIRALAAGRSYLSAPLQQATLGELIGVSTTSNLPPSGANLSQREAEVLALFAEGCTHREIAGRLGVQVKTIETYRNRLGAKFGARTREELLRNARSMGALRDEATPPPDAPSED